MRPNTVSRPRSSPTTSPTAFRAARAVKSGYVWINGASGHFYGTPFGGLKNSGLGREEGIDELLSYTEVKTVHVMLPDRPEQG